MRLEIVGSGPGKRYGDDKTIHRTSMVNVELDKHGQVVSVWFRCHPVPFDQHVASDDRAEEMRSMYRGNSIPGVKAIVFEDKKT